VTLVILKSTLIIMVAAGAAWVMRRQSASTRHLVWSVGLAAALLVPMGHWLLPEWRIPVLGPIFPENVPAPGLAVGVWIGGAILSLAWLLAGAARLARLAVSAEPIKDPRWRKAASELAGRLGLQREPRLFESRSRSALGTWGLRTPHVLLPEGARNWSDRRMRMVLAHELAHARRRDWPVQVLAEAARAIHWFNPLFWILARRLRSESERASDDAVLGLGIEGADYAEELVGMTRVLAGPKADRLPVLGFAAASELERRLVAVLNPGLRRMSAAPWAILVVVLLAVGLTLPLVAIRPEAPPSLVVPNPDGCPVTPALHETPPEDPLLAAFGSGPWHVNADRTIWVWDQPWSAGDPVRTVSIRPGGERLTVTGRRLDGTEGALESDPAPTGQLAFKTMGFLFSAAGCWEVTVRAGSGELSFVTRVAP
jgi:Zn-dependent protease with chaperone function